MCGIFGLIFHNGILPTQYQRQAVAFFNTLAVGAAERGVDATGAAKLFQNNSLHTYKIPEPSYGVIQKDEWQSFISGFAELELFAALGHTRKKTHGLNTTENAHPFVFDSTLGSLVGAHNGVITNHLSFAPSTPFSVDSANLLHKLAAAQVDEWPKILSEVLGSFALSIGRGNSFYLARNEGSPCYMAEVPAFRGMAYASTPTMLQAAAAYAGVRIDNLRALKPGKLVEFRKWKKRPVVRAFTYTTPATEWEEVMGSYYASASTGTVGVHSQPLVTPTSTKSSVTSVYLMCHSCQEFKNRDDMHRVGNKQWCKRCVDGRTRNAIMNHLHTHGTLDSAQAQAIAADVMGRRD